MTPGGWSVSLLRWLPPEAAHRIAIWAAGRGWIGTESEADDPILRCRAWELDFSNPIGLAAGFDKNAEAVDAMLGLGFGFVEAGTVTPRPQPGNPKPRMFRLAQDEAVINRMGFNGHGLDPFVRRLRARRATKQRRRGPVGANIGANRDSADPAADYVAGLATLAGLADYLAVNISSPNTPGLRDMQFGDRLDDLLARLVAARGARAVPLVLKIAPDLDHDGRRAIAAAVLRHGLDGIIVSNTTVARPATLSGRHRGEAGGLSGRPLFAPSTALLADMYILTEGRVTLVGCGGVFSGADAYAKIRAGATLVQLYTALAYHGPALVARIKRDLAACLRADGFSTVAEAVGGGAGTVIVR